MLEILLVANHGPDFEERLVGGDREAQLYHAPNRDWLGQASAQSTRGDDEAAPFKVTLLVIANCQA